jgi:hypothetical protein
MSAEVRPWLRAACARRALLAWLSVGLLLGLPAVPVHASGSAVLEQLAGNAQVLRSGMRLNALRAMMLIERDEFSTERDAAALIRMADGTALLVRGATTVRLEGLPAEDRGLAGAARDVGLYVARGAIRLATTAVTPTPRGSVTIRTITATIGIRGTDFDLIVVEPLQPRLTAPPEPGAAPAQQPEPGSYVRVTRGLVALVALDGTEVLLRPDEMGFAGDEVLVPRGAPPVPRARRVAPDAVPVARDAIDRLLEQPR